MSSTLLKNIRVYKCNEPEHWNDTIYAVLVNTAESNVFPQTYHYWVIAAGQKYEVIKVIAEMFSNTFNGNLHWRGEWHSMDNSMAFLKYALNALEHAKEITGAVPELDEYTVLYFEKDAPGADKLHNFAALEHFKIQECWGQYRLVIEHPTVSEIYWGQAIRQHYENCVHLATEPGTLNLEKLQKNLAEHCWLIPEKYRNPFKQKEQKNA